VHTAALDKQQSHVPHVESRITPLYYQILR
jgi:hypothetical protein